MTLTVTVLYDASVTKKNLSEPVLTRITVEQREALEAIAAREYRSVAAVVRRFIREGLEREAEEAAA